MQQDIASDFIDDVTENGKKVKRLSVTTEMHLLTK